MEDRKAKPSMKVVHHNDRAQIKRVLAGSGQALLPMLELLGTWKKNRPDAVVVSIESVRLLKWIPSRASSPRGNRISLLQIDTLGVEKSSRDNYWQKRPRLLWCSPGSPGVGSG